MSERRCSTALNRSGIPGVDWCVNPFVGCTHACVYCYASFMGRFGGHEAPWGTWVEPKVNVADVLARELRRPRTGEVVLSSVTDPYQPAEAQARLTRACLAALAGSGLSVSILTKSDLVVRDLDLLASFGGLLGDTRIRVGFSITTLSDELARVLEPGAPPPSRRLEALRTLAGAGIATWVFVAPALPGLSDGPDALATIADEARRCGAQTVEVDPLNFYPTAVSRLLAALTPVAPQAARALQAASRDPASWRARFRQPPPRTA